MKKEIIIKKVKIKNRLPMEIVQILKSKGTVVESKTSYSRKREKIKLLKEVRDNVV